MMPVLLVVVALLAGGLGGLVIFTAITARRVETALPARGQFIEVAGARIHYLDKGSGPSIVILHGLGGQMGNFTYALLERLTDEFRVILMDRPGSGYSRRAPGATGRLTEQAAIVAEFIRKLGLERPLLVGHSLGGAIALGVALDHPEVISGRHSSPRSHFETCAGAVPGAGHQIKLFAPACGLDCGNADRHSPRESNPRCNLQPRSSAGGLSDSSWRDPRPAAAELLQHFIRHESRQL
jgi:pimeloyl-ACP methyl ester carboxylesterase